MADAVVSSSSTAPRTSSNSAIASSSQEISDRFLTLLVAQMKNQDPMDPLDNSQLTTQLAQINTVTGIEGLNRSVTSLSSQYAQMQALQAASLVGREVIVEGFELAVDDKGQAQGGFELEVPAAVTVEILDAEGKTVDTVKLGTADAGRHGFAYDASKLDSTEGLQFRVSATAAGKDVFATALMRDTVNAVSTSGDQLTLELNRTGTTAYSDIKAFN